MSNVKKVAKNKLKVLTHKSLGDVRKVESRDGSSWYAGCDVAKVLKIKEKISNCVSGQNLELVKMPIGNQTRRTYVVNENGVKELMAKSKSNNVQTFADWLGIEHENEEPEVNQDFADMEIFKNPEFGSIRVVMVGNEPWFVSKDVAEALGYGNPQKAVRDHVDSEDRTVNESFTVNGTQGTLINESGLYSLIISSKLPTAKKFKRWVTSEVLPTIRKHGVYTTENTIENMLSNPDFAIQTFTKLKEEMEARKKAEEELAYKSEVLQGMTDDIPLAEKRRRISKIVRKGVYGPQQIAQRWNLLYSEFEMKFHMNLDQRLKSRRLNTTASKSKLDLIDKELNMIPELYGLCCKLFESDFEKIRQELEGCCVKEAM